MSPGPMRPTSRVSPSATVFVATAGTSVHRQLLSALPEAAHVFASHVADPFRGEGKEPADDVAMVDLARKLGEDEVLRSLILAHGRSSISDFCACSAELQSLFSAGPPQPREGDQLILACSDNTAGLESAVSVGYLVGAGTRVGVAAGDRSVDETLSVRVPGLLSGSVGTPGDLRGVEVSALRVEHLNALNADRFQYAAAGIGRLLNWAYQLASGGELVIHVTGGYKATIPFVLAVAAHLPDGPTRVSGWVRHEDSKACIRVPIMRVGIEESLGDTIAAIRAGDPPPSARWKDYAYERRGEGRFVLTALGEALDRLWS